MKERTALLLFSCSFIVLSIVISLAVIYGAGLVIIDAFSIQVEWGFAQAVAVWLILLFLGAIFRG